LSEAKYLFVGCGVALWAASLQITLDEDSSFLVVSRLVAGSWIF